MLMLLVHSIGGQGGEISWDQVSRDYENKKVT